MSNPSPKTTTRTTRPWKPKPNQLEILKGLVDFGEYGRYENVFPEASIARLVKEGLVEKFVPVARYYSQAYLGRRRYVKITEKGKEVLKGIKK
jgi:hypothetical protein